MQAECTTKPASQFTQCRHHSCIFWGKPKFPSVLGGITIKNSKLVTGTHGLVWGTIEVEPKQRKDTLARAIVAYNKGKSIEDQIRITGLIESDDLSGTIDNLNEADKDKALVKLFTERIVSYSKKSDADNIIPEFVRRKLAEQAVSAAAGEVLSYSLYVLDVV